MTRRTDILGLFLLVLATVVGLWLGLSGPDVSPVFSQLPFPPDLGGGPGGAR
jgi:hypothetical protein